MIAHAVEAIPESVPVLRGLSAPWMRRCLAQPETLRDAIRTYGSPLNILCVSPFHDNIQGFEKVLQEAVDSYFILYARKPNKAQVFVREALARGIGVDVASDDELVDVLRVGYAPEHVCVTASLLTDRLASRVVDHGILTVVENEDQVALLERTAASKGRRHPILIRVGGIGLHGPGSRTRLGFLPDVVRGIIRAFAEGAYPNLTLQGFHFHINGYSPSPRVEGVEKLIEFVDLARSLGIDPTIVDIGGGFPVNYLESGDEWQHFQHELRRSLCGVRGPITWNNDGLGLSYVEGRFHGSPEVYPYFNERPKWLMLKDLLNASLKTGERVADAINRRGLQLRIEPGRAALDQSGISIASVVHRSYDSGGELCVGLDMNFTQLRSSSADFLVDPVLVPAARNGDSVECYISGSYCMDRDLILKRKVFLPQTPAPGDVVCFLNTAGYMMHFLESPGHGFGLAANLVFDPHTESLTFEPRGEP